MNERHGFKWTNHEHGVCQADAEFHAYCEEHKQTLPLTRESLKQLPREVELEFYRRMPAWMADELGFGKSEDDPLLIVLREVDHGVWKYVF
ncbi:MAG: hypothetical protein F4X02_10650 [Chloroflexi bacterium]|nr:hypothetical protein [Chloroflexota bacterium]